MQWSQKQDPTLITSRRALTPHYVWYRSHNEVYQKQSADPQLCDGECLSFLNFANNAGFENKLEIEHTTFLYSHSSLRWPFQALCISGWSAECQLWSLQAPVHNRGEQPVESLSEPENLPLELEYASIVWDPYTKIISIDRLEMIQHKAVRFIYSKYRNSDSPSILMMQNSIQTLLLRRKIQTKISVCTEK